jgi:hypothetical protein
LQRIAVAERGQRIPVAAIVEPHALIDKLRLRLENQPSRQRDRVAAFKRARPTATFRN